MSAENTSPKMENLSLTETPPHSETNANNDAGTTTNTSLGEVVSGHTDSKGEAEDDADPKNDSGSDDENRSMRSDDDEEDLPEQRIRVMIREDGRISATHVCLPRLAFEEDLEYGIEHFLHEEREYPLELNHIAIAIQEGATGALKDYLSNYQQANVADVLLSQVVGSEWPVLFYAVERNDADVLRLLLRYKKGPELANIASRWGGVPLLAYAILHGGQTKRNTLELVKILLASGADPCIIPKKWWSRYLEDDEQAGISDKLLAAHVWCCSGLLNSLFESTTLSQKYFLYKAATQDKKFACTDQADNVHQLSRLQDLPYWLVGQDAACRTILKQLYSYTLRKDKQPMTMMFAGPSGHGKTEMAERLADLMGLPFQFVDCAQIDTAWALLGSDNGFVGSEEGSQLNNFLTRNQHQRNVVFLDEIDKTNQSVWDALLLMCDSGRYKDRRYNADVDCTKTIFIFATNQGSTVIESFYAKNMAHVDDGKKGKVPVEELKRSLHTNFIQKFGAPFTGRMRCIVPFFPFSLGEQAVITHGILLQIAEDLRKPIDIEKRDLVAHAHLAISKEADVCATIARTSYMIQLGARSLKNAVTDEVRVPIDDLWRRRNIIRDESKNNGSLMRFTVQLEPTESGPMRVAVSKEGSTSLGFPEERTEGVLAKNQKH